MWKQTNRDSLPEAYRLLHTHARTRLHTIAQSRTHACTNACMHAHIPSYIQTDRRHILIHTYIYNVHFRQTDKHTTDESRRQTDGIYTYIRTHVRTYIHKLCLFHYLSVCPSDCLSISACVLSFCLPPSLRTCLSACLPFCLSIGR